MSGQIFKVIHIRVVETFASPHKCQHHGGREGQGITKVSRIHPRLIMNACTKCHNNSSNYCRDISVWNSGEPSNIATGLKPMNTCET